VDLRVGSSGFSYDFWKGSFYPADIDGDEMLAYYGQRFRTVEINNTFYRMPKADVLRRWGEAVPHDFRFAIKASRRITHDNKLAGTADNVSYLYRQLESLGDRLGCVLFQCPPYLRKNLDLLRGFFDTLPVDHRAVIELRHRGWYDDEVYALLAERGVGLAASDEDNPAPVMRATAGFGYLRLREADYDEAALRAWIDRLAAQWSVAYVFFKHEETAPAIMAKTVALTAGADGTSEV
jgi:uncharacterized protein YecE (DUF72 family)